MPVESDLYDLVDLGDVLGMDAGTSYLLRAEGDSMVGAGIQAGDTLVVNVGVEPRNGAVVVAAVGGELTVKRARVEGGRITLEACNPDYLNPQVGPDGDDARVWGVVASVIHDLRR